MLYFESVYIHETHLLTSFNGKWQGFAMVCSESELRLVGLFTFACETKFLRNVIKLGQLARGRLLQK